MSPRAEAVLGVVVMILLAAVWIVSPGAAVLVIGGAIGGLALLAWVVRTLRI